MSEAAISLLLRCNLRASSCNDLTWARRLSSSDLVRGRVRVRLRLRLRVRLRLRGRGRVGVGVGGRVRVRARVRVRVRVSRLRACRRCEDRSFASR